MQRNTIGIDLEPEDVELLTKVTWETGKSANQLALEAIRMTYGTRFDSGSNSDYATTLLEVTHKIERQAQEVLAVVKKQRQQIDLISSNSKQDPQHFYPPS